MKYIFLVLLFVCVVFAGCESNNQRSRFIDVEPGSVSGNIYTNASLGMSMQIPTDYVVKPAPMEDAAPGASEQAQRLKRQKRLFFICKEKFNCNNSLLGVLQDTSYARGANTPEKYYKYLIADQSVQHEKLKIKGHFKEGTTTLGGKEFYTLSVKREDSHGRFLKLEKDIYFHLNGSNLIQITLNAEDEKDRALLKKAVESIKFEE